MICIHFYMPDNRVMRLPRDEAEEAVRSGRARYVPRKVWKARTRDREPME